MRWVCSLQSIISPLLASCPSRALCRYLCSVSSINGNNTKSETQLGRRVKKLNTKKGKCIYLFLKKQKNKTKKKSFSSARRSFRVAREWKEGASGFLICSPTFCFSFRGPMREERKLEGPKTWVECNWRWRDGAASSAGSIILVSSLQSHPFTWQFDKQEEALLFHVLGPWNSNHRSLLTRHYTGQLNVIALDVRSAGKVMQHSAIRMCIYKTLHNSRPLALNMITSIKIWMWLKWTRSETMAAVSTRNAHTSRRFSQRKFHYFKKIHAVDQFYCAIRVCWMQIFTLKICF